MRNLFNFIGFQLVWVSSVWGAASGMWWLGPLAVLLFMAAHFGFGQAAKSDLRLIGWAVLIGALVDSVFAFSGMLRYASPVPLTWLAPAWILSMWVSFALTLNHSLGWMRGRLGIQMAFGAVGGPLAYWIAERAWGAVTFGTSLPIVILSLAIAWAIVTPLLLYLANHKGPEAPR